VLRKEENAAACIPAEKHPPRDITRFAQFRNAKQIADEKGVAATPRTPAPRFLHLDLSDRSADSGVPNSMQTRNRPHAVVKPVFVRNLHLLITISSIRSRGRAQLYAMLPKESSSYL
jgi:hypothetical protein